MFIRIKSQLREHYAFAQTINPKNNSLLSFLSGKFKVVINVLPVQPLVAVCNTEKQGIVKSSPLLVMALFTLFFCSCQKEKLADPVLNSATSGSSADARFNFPFLPGRGNNSNKNIRYGASIGVPDASVWLSFQTSVADQLGVSCLRASTLVPSTYSVNNLLISNYDVVLNFNSDRGSGDELIPFVSDLDLYKINLQAALLTYTVKPVVAVIENEESNRFYYSGSAMEYVKQLNAAIDVMHANGIKVANGGLTSTGLCYLVYQDLLNQGKEDAAEEFRKLTHVTPNSPFTQERGAFIDTLLQAYTQMDLDYVNFHYKGDTPDDAEALKDIIDYLQKRTGKPVISNELGQFDKDPNTLLALLQVFADENSPYVLWYSPDEHAGKKDTPLQHSDASLTSSGVAYQDYLAD